MSLNRIFAVFYKDAMWAMYNTKLLALVLMPPMMSLLFQFTGKGLLLAFSIVFTFSMIGSFLGSYLITEEKRIESLKNILITPLTNRELAIGKFLLPLVLCLVFSFVNFAIAGKLDLFVKPTVFASLALMSAIASLLGLLLGLIAKNEQELGVVAPIFILVLMAGTLQTKVGGNGMSGYFPEYHMVHLIENHSLLSTQQRLAHLAFLFFELLATLLVVSVYLRFYFSSDSDSRRFSVKTILSCVPFIIFLAVSGATANYFRIDSTTTAGQAQYTLKGAEVQALIVYDQTAWDMQQSQTDKINTLRLISKTSTHEIMAVVVHLDDDEMTPEQRRKKYTDEGLYYIVDQNTKPGSNGFSYYTYTKGHEYKSAYERQCGREVLRFHFMHPLDAAEFKKINDWTLEFLKNLKFECTPQK